MADGHHDVHRLLLRHSLDRHNERTAHLPNVGGLLSAAQHDVVDGTVVKCKAAHALDIRIDLALVAVKRQQNVRARIRTRIFHAGKALTEGYDLAFHELDCGRVGVRLQDGQHAADTRAEVSKRHEHAHRGLRLGKKAQQALGDDRQRTLRADEQVLERQSARVLHLLAADFQHRAVRKNDLQPAHIIACYAVLDCTHTARIGADVAADARGFFTRVGRIKQTTFLDISLQILEQHTRLGGDRHRVAIQLEHTVHAGYIQNDTTEQRNCRAYQIGARAARRDRDAVFVGVPEHAADLLGREREHERIRRAGAAAKRIAQVFRRDVLCEKQTFFIRNDILQSLFAYFHCCFLLPIPVAKLQFRRQEERTVGRSKVVRKFLYRNFLPLKA